MSSDSDQSKIKIQQQDPLFVNINPDNPVSEIESFCVNCEENGITRILMTKIPFFKEIIIMAFECPHCGYRDSEVQPGQVLAEHGIRVELGVTTTKVKFKKVFY